MSSTAYKEMESVVNVSAVLYKLRIGSERAVSKVLPTDQSLSKH
jgi:hypothetical protein